MILYLQNKGHMTGRSHASPPPTPHLHHFLVPARPFEGPEGKAAGGGVVEGHADAPQVHRGPVLLLMVLPQDGALIHVWVLQSEHVSFCANAADILVYTGVRSVRV